MSRIGRKLINIPAGVTVNYNADEHIITVKGPKAELSTKVNTAMSIEIDDATIKVIRPNDSPENKALHGLTRTLVANMVDGVTKGFTKALEIIGTGYKVAKSGNGLELTLGYSHPVIIPEIKGISFDVTSATTFTVSGADKQLVGQIAAEIRAKRPPEPYHGKGVRYAGEFVKQKEGKTGKK